MHEINQRDVYIEELEFQLSDVRSQLLELKLTLTDKDDAISSLQNQIQSAEQAYKQLDDSKKELDELIIKVSKEMRSRDYDQRDLTYQAHQDREQLIREVGALKEQMHREREAKGQLEMIEGDLVHRLQVKESEVLSLRAERKQLDGEILLKTEALEKAQRVIEKFSEEMERHVETVQRLERERNNARAENKGLMARLVDVSRTKDGEIAEH